MNETQLQREVMTSPHPRRAARRNIALAGAAAAIGGAVGTGAVVLAILPLAHSAIATHSTPASAAIELSAAPTVVPAPIVTPAIPAATGTPAFVLHADAPRLVIAPTVDDAWLRGEPTMSSEDDVRYVLERQVDARDVPAIHTSLVGRQAALFDDAGNRCTARVGQLSAMLSVVEDFEDKPDTVARRQNAWTYGEPALVARIEDIEGDCEGNLVAGVIVDDGASPSAISRSEITVLDSDDILAAASRRAFTTTPEYAAIQREFEKQGGKGAWYGSGEPDVTLVGDAHHGLVVVSTSVGGCGEFEGTLAAAYEVREGDLRDRIAIPSNVELAELVLAADTNADGVPEIFVKQWFWATSIWTSGASGFASDDGAEVVAHVCPC